MPAFLSTIDEDFEDRFRVFLDRKRDADASVDEEVAAIIADVRRRGDDALIEYTRKFDDLELKRGSFAYSDGYIRKLAESVSVKDSTALRVAAARIESHHKRQVPHDDFWLDSEGVETGWRFEPIESIGHYVPGGKASYPSTVLMNAIPALVAGVKGVSMAAPAPSGVSNPLVFFAATLVDVKTIYPIGGAQAIAAFAYGTETIRSVDKITGPGNSYVSAAKRQVFGRVGIDMIAGPSEVFVIADSSSNPEWIAADLLAQAEHDEAAQALLATDDECLGRKVAACVEEQLASLPRRDIAGASWRDFGAVIVTRDLDEAANIANLVAPEHLEICTRDPGSLHVKVSSAGAIFLGHYTPETVGDYIAGSNHVLPTSGAARFSGGLSVLDFLKRVTYTKFTPRALEELGPHAKTLAAAEGLDGHARAIQVRLKNKVGFEGW